jgi:hypothetical protein
MVLILWVQLDNDFLSLRVFSHAAFESKEHKNGVTN